MSNKPTSDEAYIYMLTNNRGNVLYIGSTENLKKRMYFHKRGLIAGFTKKYNVHRLVYFEGHPNAVVLSERVFGELSNLVPGTQSFEALNHRYQQDILKLFDLGPRLLVQILEWLDTDKVAKDKIISLWKLAPTAIGKGKIGKPVEFGRKWVVNCYRGGYVLLTAPTNPKISDQDCVWESLCLHQENFSDPPKSYATDRGMWGAPNLELCLSAGIEKTGIQPKGRAKALVNQAEHRRLSNRRAGIEPRIGHLKTRGLGRSRMKSDLGVLISGYRSALSYNLMRLMKDLSLQPVPIRR